jgi:hypothetical protein
VAEVIKEFSEWKPSFEVQFPRHMSLPSATSTPLTVDADTACRIDSPHALICAGDVLNFRGRFNALSRLGSSGGFMGHVVLAVSEMRPLLPEAEVAQLFEEFAADGRNTLYAVNIVECSRDTTGLSESTLILYVNIEGGVFVGGEINGPQLTSFDEPEEVHIWHGPLEFREKSFREDFMHEVLTDMRKSQHSWSWSTALRAFWLSSDLSHSTEAPVTLKEIRECWQVEPICSSIVVIFWQKYLLKLALCQHANPLDLILKYMPLKADRVLPGELLYSMLSHGWTLSKPKPDKLPHFRNEEASRIRSQTL